MKGLGPSVIFGCAVAVLLFGVILAIEPDVPPVRDRWLEAWKEAGLKRTQFLAAAPAGESWVLLRELRDALREREHDDSFVRRYQINMIRAEVLKVASPGLIEEIPDGRHLKFRLEKGSRPVHVARSGRYILFVSTTVGTAVMRFRSNSKTVSQIIDIFEETVEQDFR